MTNWIRGTGVAMVTPFTPGGEVDFPALDRIVEHLISGRIEYLVVMGTTGETATLTSAERQAVTQRVLEVNAGRIPVVLGIGGNNTAELVEKVANPGYEGLSAILSVSPYYNKPTQEGIYQHYAALARVSALPIILYNVPGRTASNMSAETTLRLARDFDNIIATKEASGNFDQFMTILRDKPDGFELVSGDDSITLPMISLGAQGVISVAANAFPGPFSDMVRLALQSNFSEARELQYRLLDLMNLYFEEGNPAGVKAAMGLQGLCDTMVRLPLVPASPTLKKKITAAWEQAFSA